MYGDDNDSSNARNDTLRKQPILAKCANPLILQIDRAGWLGDDNTLSRLGQRWGEMQANIGSRRLPSVACLPSQ